MNDLLALIMTITKNVGIAFLLLLFAAFVSRGDSKEETEAKRLGFDSISEMERIHAEGWHTKAQYVADETSRAQRFGFKDIEELHEADDVGAANKEEYSRYLREKERKEAQAQADASEGGYGAQARYDNNSNFPIGCYSYRDLNNSTGLWCSGTKFALTLERYKEICSKVSAISRIPFLSWHGELSYDDNAARLLRSGGSIGSIKSSWVESKDGLQGGCKISVSVSGVYEGTSTRGVAVAFADGFRIDDEGDVIAASGPSGLVWLR
jgi:hypothetical protein